MKRKELINLSKEELNDKLVGLEKQLMELNFQRRTAHVEKPHQFRQTKKDIARILTILKEKENES